MNNLFKTYFTIVGFIIPKLVFSKNNIIYGRYENQINLNFATNLRKDKINNKDLEKLYMFMFQYSQPDEFFRLQARKNFEILGTFSFNNDMSENNQFAIDIYKDVIIPLFSNLYFGAGLGIYVKNKINSRIGSKFTFGQKYFVRI